MSTTETEYYIFTNVVLHRLMGEETKKTKSEKRKEEKEKNGSVTADMNI